MTVTAMRASSWRRRWRAMTCSEHFAAQLVRGESVEWSRREQAVLARRTVTLGSLVLEDKPLAQVPPEGARAAMLRGVRELGVAALPWDRDARDLQARIEFVRAALGAEACRLAGRQRRGAGRILDGWLAPWLDGVTRREHLARICVAEALRGTFVLGAEARAG